MTPKLPKILEIAQLKFGGKVCNMMHKTSTIIPVDISILFDLNPVFEYSQCHWHYKIGETSHEFKKKDSSGVLFFFNIVYNVKLIYILFDYVNCVD